MAMMDEEMAETPATMPMEEEEKSSIFLPKSSLGGKECKPGDTLTLKVQDVDPETGDVEAVMEGYEHKSNSGYQEDFDRAMPEESEMA